MIATMTHSPEVRVPPVAVGLLAAGAMGWAAWALPSLRVNVPGHLAWGAAVAVTGALIAIAGVVAFRRARTTVNPLTPGAASSLVTDGIYRRTRNPMYLGFAIALAGWAIGLAAPIALLGVVAFIVYMNRFQIAPEERALRARFGAAFDAYAATVRRWL
jgi:protein-S-isoprenylcysteine O-methyltransferase Ste14